MVRFRSCLVWRVEVQDWRHKNNQGCTNFYNLQPWEDNKIVHGNFTQESLTPADHGHHGDVWWQEVAGSADKGGAGVRQSSVYQRGG